MKNNRIQFWRIIFTFMIALYHFNNAYDHYTSWYISVEFFFIVSGYLLVKKYESLSAKGKIESYSATDYTFNKVKHFYPHYIFSFLVAFLGFGYLRGYSMADYATNLIKHLPEVFMVQTVGLNMSADYYVNSVTWYLSVLLIIGYLIFFLLKKDKKLYTECIAPFSIIFIYAYLFRTYGFIGEHRETVGFFLNSAFLRGLADLNLGVICYYAAKKCQESGKYEHLRRWISDICFIVVIVFAFTKYQTAYDFFFTFLLFIAITFAFADTKHSILYDNWIVTNLAKLTMAIYLNHKMFRVIFKKIWPVCSVKVALIYLAVITLYSLCTYTFIYIMIPKICLVFRKERA